MLAVIVNIGDCMKKSVLKVQIRQTFLTAEEIAKCVLLPKHNSKYWTMSPLLTKVLWSLSGDIGLKNINAWP